MKKLYKFEETFKTFKKFLKIDVRENIKTIKIRIF